MPLVLVTYSKMYFISKFFFLILFLMIILWHNLLN